MNHTEAIGHTGGRDPAPFRALVERMAPGGALLDLRVLTGGVSAEVTALAVRWTDGTVRRVVVRRHGARDLARNPDAARDEFRLMEITRAHGLPTPEPIYLDTGRDLFPTPVVVVGFVDGSPDDAPAAIDRLADEEARVLARIHRVRATSELAFLRSIGQGWGDRPSEPDESMHESRIRAALEAACPLAAAAQPVLLHGDFWPGNLLWRDGTIAAVIDWEDACTGDPLIDVGIARFELALAHGPAAAERFTVAYLDASGRPATDLAHLPCWDLCAALHACGRIGLWAADRAEEARMRAAHTAFMEAALERLR